MKLLAFLSLFAVAYGFHHTETTEKLLWSNLNNIFRVNDICWTVKKDNYLRNDLTFGSEDLLVDNNRFNLNLNWDVNRKIQHCCNKFSVYEKKQCLKNIKFELKSKTQNMDLWTTGRDYTFVNEDVFDIDNKYSRLMNTMDIGSGLRYDVDSRLGGIDNWVYGVDRDVTDNSIHSLLLKKCTKNSNCRRKIERTTDIVARKACSENMMKNGRLSFDTCYRAGQIVGQHVGKHNNREVCRPSWYKFQTKIQGCGLNHKYECRKAFRAGCKVGKNVGIIKTGLTTNDRTFLIEDDIFRNDVGRNEIFDDDVMVRGDTLGLTNYWL